MPDADAAEILQIVGFFMHYPEHVVLMIILAICLSLVETVLFLIVKCILEVAKGLAMLLRQGFAKHRRFPTAAIVFMTYGLIAARLLLA